MIPGMSLKSDTNIKLPLSFILFGIVAFVIAQIILFISHGFLTIGQFRVPSIWSGSHFLLLGFAVMISMGAMYQLVPVAFLTPIWNQTFGIVQFFVTAIGITLFAMLLGTHPLYAIYGAVITIIGIFMFIFQMMKTMMQQKQKNIMSFLVIGALIAFFFTINAGLLLAWNFSFTPLAKHYSILLTHMTLGVAGWFTLLIFGFSYKLVPMFSLSHGFSMKWASRSFIVYSLGLLTLISSYWFTYHFLQTCGWILLLLGFSFFTFDIREMLAKRLRKKLDKPFSFSLLAIGIGLVVHMVACILSFAHITNITIWSWVAFLYIMGWIIFSILGYLYKIVPFLWWTYRYSKVIGKEKVPTLKEMINEKMSSRLYILFIVSTLGLTIAGILNIGIAVFLFQGLLTVTSIIYSLTIIKVFFI